MILCNKYDILMINAICNFMHLYESEFSTVTPLMALMSKSSYLNLINLKFSVFHEAFFKLKIFCQQCDNFGEKTIIVFRCFKGYSLRGWQPW
jgi:hypothetical protein